MLRFTPTAWAKLHYFCHRNGTEIGGFGLTAAHDPLLVIDLLTVKQQVTSVSVDFDDEAVADLFDAQVDAGIPPERFARIWCHTHPGHSAAPSGTDEETFARVFGRCDWAVMFILARQGETYARLRFNVGPGGEVLIPVAVDYTRPFDGADHAAWEAEYAAHVQPVAETFGSFNTGELDAFDDLDAWPDDDPAGSGGEVEAVGDLDDLARLLEHDTEV